MKSFEISIIARLNLIELQRIMRTMLKPVIVLVSGYVIGGGNVLHVVSNLTIAADKAGFGQTGPTVGSFDGGFGASYLSSFIGQKKAQEFGFFAGSTMHKRHRSWAWLTK